MHADTHHGAVSDRVFFVIQNSDGEIEVLVDREDESVDGAVAFAEHSEHPREGGSAGDHLRFSEICGSIADQPSAILNIAKSWTLTCVLASKSSCFFRRPYSSLVGMADGQVAPDQPHNDNPRVTQTDLRIAQRAIHILDSPARWNRADTRVCHVKPCKQGCPDNAKTFSLYCALRKATTEVTGKFDHPEPRWRKRDW